MFKNRILSCFQRHQFSIRVYSIIGIALLFLLTLQLHSLFTAKESMFRNQREFTRNSVSLAVRTLEYFHSRTDLSQEEAFAQAIKALSHISPKAANAYTIFDASNGHLYLQPEGKTGSIFALYHSRDTDEIAAKKLRQLIEDAPDKYYSTILPVERNASSGAIEYVDKMNVYTVYKPWNIIVVAGNWLDLIESIFTRQLRVMLFWVVITAITLTIFGFLIARSLLRQLGGEPSVAKQVLERAAAGDFRTDTALSYVRKNSLLAAFSHMTHSIQAIIQRIRKQTSNLRVCSQDIDHAVQEVLRYNQEQSDAKAEIGQAVESMNQSVQQLSEASAQTKVLSESVTLLSNKSTSDIGLAAKEMAAIVDAVQHTSIKMQELSQKTNAITTIAAAIKNIASQTNLLALNAAIEAARAGEQGSGFSVVADEVRNLAESTASATVEIEKMLEEVKHDTVESARLMDQILPLVDKGNQLTQTIELSLKEISQQAHSTMDFVGQVHAVAFQQIDYSSKISNALDNLSHHSESTFSAMEKTRETTTALAQLAQDFEEMVDSYQI